jgi:hypothetical protein
MATKARKHEDFTKVIKLILFYFVYPRLPLVSFIKKKVKDILLP